MKLSIVTTLYQSEQYVEPFYRRATAAARRLTDDYEIVFVNDGSPDDSLARAITLTETDDRVVVIDLARNFGHHRAMMTGLAQARGERVFLIDSDLEEEPEWLESFAEQMERDRCDVVHGVQRERKGDLIERWTGLCYYLIHRLLTGLQIPYNITTARLMSRRYVDALMQFEEREIDIGGLWYIAGFDQRAQTVTKHSTSRSTYTLGKKIAIIINSVTSFSDRPLIAIFYVGITILLTAFAYSAYLLGHWIGDAEPISGWTSVMVSIWFLGGVILSSVGVLGIYLAKIFLETKRRPLSIIRSIHGKRTTP